MKKYFELIKNTGLFAIASMAGKLISFFFLPIYTYYLTTEEYAIVDLSNVIQSLIWPIISLSIAEAVLRFALDKDEDKKGVFTNGSIVIASGLLIFICIAPFVDINSGLNLYKSYFIIYFIILSLNSFLGVFSRTIDKVKLIVVNSTISCFSIAIFNVLFLTRFNWGIKGYFSALILGNSISLISYLIFGEYKNYFSLKAFDKILLKKMIIYSIPLIPNAVFWWINSSIDKAFLTAMTGLTQVGLYSVASKIPSILNMITSIFQQAWGISASKEINGEDTRGFFTNIYIVYNLVIIICSIGLISLTKSLAIILFNKNFYSAWTIVPILILSFYYSSLNIYYGSIFTATKKTKTIFYTTGIGALVNLSLNYFMIVKFGTIGAAIATCISNFVVYIIRVIVANKIIKININWIIEAISQILIVILIVNIETIDLIYLTILINSILILIRINSIKFLIYKFKKIKK